MATCEATHIYQFITNNHALFHLWWKENLLNHQKVSRYYKHSCRGHLQEPKTTPNFANYVKFKNVTLFFIFKNSQYYYTCHNALLFLLHKFKSKVLKIDKKFDCFLNLNDYKAKSQHKKPFSGYTEKIFSSWKHFYNNGHVKQTTYLPSLHLFNENIKLKNQM